MAHELPPSVSSGTPTVDLAPIKRALAVRDAVQGPRTHWEGCWTEGHHRDCAIAILIAEVERLRTALSALSGQTAPQEVEAGEALAVAMLAACEATLRHLWDIAGRFENRQCNQIRDEIHILNKHTLPAIQDAVKVAALSSASTPENEGSEQQQNETTKI